MFRIFEDSSEVEVSLDSNQVTDWGLQVIHTSLAWEVTHGEGIRVAVLDTGGSDHPDLAPNIEKCIGDMDTAGHGTHVAGIIGAADNKFGVVGVAPMCRLTLVKVLPGDGAGIGAAIRQVADDGVDIISMSIGSYENDPELHAAVQYAHRLGVVQVAAAGNAPDKISYPGMYLEVIAVSALDEHLVRAQFAPIPPNHIALPGVNVLSTWLGGQYARLSGTSQATPLMAGIIALILSHYRPSRDLVHDTVHRQLQRIDEAHDKVFYTPNLALL